MPRPEPRPRSLSIAGGACRALADAVARAGYGELTTSVSPLVASDTTTALWHAHGQLPDELATLADLFAFGRAVPKTDVERVLGSGLVSELQSVSILRSPAEDRLATCGLALRLVHGLWYLHELPGPSPQMYYGDDSFALMWRQAVHRGRTLDLCSGPGIQLLHAVRQGGSGVGVEANRFASSLARINAEMNGLESRVELVVGDLYEPLAADERFDAVLANPPLLPLPEDLPYAFVGHGGEDGFALTWRILEGLPNVLHPTGLARVVATGLSDGIELCVEPRLTELAVRTGLDIVVTIAAHVHYHPGAPFFEGLAKSASAGAGTDLEPTRAALTAHLERHHASHLAGCSIVAMPGRGACIVHDISAANSASFFFR